MKNMENFEYGYMVEKLASELCENAIMEKIAEEEEAASSNEQQAVPNEVLQAILAKKKNEESEDSDKEEEDDEEKEAAYAEAILEKAAAVYQESEAIEQAAINALNEAAMYKSAATKIFEDAGLL